MGFSNGDAESIGSSTQLRRRRIERQLVLWRRRRRNEREHLREWSGSSDYSVIATATAAAVLTTVYTTSHAAAHSAARAADDFADQAAAISSRTAVGRSDAVGDHWTRGRSTEYGGVSTRVSAIRKVNCSVSDQLPTRRWYHQRRGLEERNAEGSLPERSLVPIE
jgi:hypothetical protein